MLQRWRQSFGKFQLILEWCIVKLKFDEGSVVFHPTDWFNFFDWKKVTSVLGYAIIGYFISSRSPRHCLYCCPKFALSASSNFWHDVYPCYYNFGRRVSPITKLYCFLTCDITIKPIIYGENEKVSWKFFTHINEKSVVIFFLDIGKNLTKFHFNNWIRK